MPVKVRDRALLLFQSSNVPQASRGLQKLGNWVLVHFEAEISGNHRPPRGRIVGMERRFQFRLVDWLLVAAAAPIWLYTMRSMEPGPGWGPPFNGYLFLPGILILIAALIYKLTRHWAVSALFAPVVAMLAWILFRG